LKVLSSLGAQSLNIELQQALNPDGQPRIEKFGLTFAAGDIGFIRAIDAEAGETVIDFDGRGVSYDFDELDAVVPAYATAIHKSPGSEYPAVVIPLTTQHYTMLQRNLLDIRASRAPGSCWSWWAASRRSRSP
jgi:exodeoxyribonuclease V alpha subunit